MTIQSKLKSPLALKKTILKLRKSKSSGKKGYPKIVFTNGCFDLLHPGHVTYLEKARSLGDILVVALNTDASVRRLKGKERPLNSLKDRMTVIAALASVDYVTSFGEDTPLKLIQSLLPDGVPRTQ